MDRVCQGPLQPVYMFYGRERFFVDRCAAAIRERIVPSPDLRDVLVQVFHGSETSVDEVLAAAHTPPFFHNLQMILVRDADKLKDPGWVKTAAYLDRPASFSCVVFLAGDTLPKAPASPFARKLGADACIGFPALTPAQRRAWVVRIAREKGVEDRLSRELMAGFLEEGYVPLATIEQRLEMLCLYSHGEDAADGPLQLPSEWAGGLLEKGYVFTDAILNGKEGEALALLHRFLEQGTAPLLILSRIAWEIRRILQLQDARRRGESWDAAVRTAGIQPFAKKRYLALADRLPARVVDRLPFALLEADRVMKSSRVDLQWHLEDLCVRIVRSLHGP